MNRGENMEKCYDSIMELCADDFKAMINRLHIFLKNKAIYSIDVPLPNYLWAIKPGGGNTTLVKVFTEYLYAAKAVEFCGMVKSFEFKLDYIAPGDFFSELTRLDNTITGFAGHNRFFKGVVCIDIDDWVKNVSEDHFVKLLSYVSSNSDKLLVIFCVHTDNKNSIDAVEATISSHMRLETLTLRFPEANELVGYVESRYISKGFYLTEDARALLRDTIGELSAGKYFNGFKSIKQLANDILYSLLATDMKGRKEITGEMLSGYTKDSTYVKQRVKGQSGMKKAIGFTSERGI